MPTAQTMAMKFRQRDERIKLIRQAAADELVVDDNLRLRRRLELRRSNAAAPHRNRKKYTRKVKHPKREA